MAKKKLYRDKKSGRYVSKEYAKNNLEKVKEELVPIRINSKLYKEERTC